MPARYLAISCKHFLPRGRIRLTDTSLPFSEPRFGHAVCQGAEGLCGGHQDLARPRPLDMIGSAICLLSFKAALLRGATTVSLADSFLIATAC